MGGIGPEGTKKEEKKKADHETHEMTRKKRIDRWKEKVPCPKGRGSFYLLATLDPFFLVIADFFLELGEFFRVYIAFLIQKGVELFQSGDHTLQSAYADPLQISGHPVLKKAVQAGNAFIVP